MAHALLAKPAKSGGDDLDDQLDLDPDLLASSDAEGSGSGSLSDGEFDEDQDEDDLDDDDVVNDGAVTSQPQAESDEDTGDRGVGVAGVKRKAVDLDEEERKAEKKRRKKEKGKERKARRQEKDKDEQAKEKPPTHMTTSELSSLLLRSIRETFPSASSIELEELVLPEDRLLPPADYAAPDSSADPLKSLERRVISLIDPLKTKKLRPATPRVIILALSGLRCADIVRGVRDVKGQGEVAKLFAKHFKLAEQAKFLERTKVSIAVGTPGRVGKLLAEDALKVNKDTVVLLDISHRDSKTMTLLTLREVRAELWKGVFSGKAREVLLNGGAKIGAI